jgi:hypothetical protein
MLVRRRPLLRAAAIGGGAYMVGKNRAQHQAESGSAQGGSQQSGSAQGGSQQSGSAQGGSQQSSSQQGQAAAVAASSHGSSMTDELHQLSGLHQQGSLNDSEFAAAKAKLLGT